MDAANDSLVRKVKKFFFAVNRQELKKIAPLLIICFLFSMNYYILKTMKDALLIAADDAGAKAIPFIKVWVLLPVMALFSLLFTWLTNRYSMRTVFYLVVSTFLFFFGLFTFVFYPLRETLQPDALADTMQRLLPLGWQGLVAVIRHWPISTFYVMAESWSCIVYSVLFWGFANEVTKLGEAKRYYPLLLLVGNLSAIAAGWIAIALSPSKDHPHFYFGNTPWEETLISLTFVILLCGGASLAFFSKINAHTVRVGNQLSQDKSSHMSLRETFAYLAKSKYILSIALMVLTYNLVINLTEIVWKDKIYELYPTPGDYNAYMSKVTIWIGFVSAFITLFICSNSLHFLGWTATAMATPFFVLVTGVAFFAFLIFPNNANSDLFGLAAALGTTPIALAAFLGSLQNCLGRSGKYTLFDTSKELAFIPLDSTTKLHGKAAVDGMGSQIGKAGSSIIYQVLLILLPSVASCVPYVGMVLVMAIAICMISIYSLGQHFALQIEKGKASIA